MRAAIPATVVLTVAFAAFCTSGFARDGDTPVNWQNHHAVLLLGLPGDAPHEQEFRSLANALAKSLSICGLPREHILVLDHDPPAGSETVRPVTRESITKTFRVLQETLGEDDSLWVVFIGHGNYDGENARFHIPGPDMRAIDYADLLRDIRCREQVLWLTMSSSGWFLEPLSKKNRVVVTSTLKDAEPNETEFPAAMVEALDLPVVEVDENNDGQVSVLELFGKIHGRVAQRYESDQLAATEHAMIDDNGDGRGTEWSEILKHRERIAKTGVDEPTNVDGQLAAEVFIGQTPPDTTATSDVEAETDPDEDVKD